MQRIQRKIHKENLHLISGLDVLGHFQIPLWSHQCITNREKKVTETKNKQIWVRAVVQQSRHIFRPFFFKSSLASFIWACSSRAASSQSLNMATLYPTAARE